MGALVNSILPYWAHILVALTSIFALSFFGPAVWGLWKTRHERAKDRVVARCQKQLAKLLRSTDAEAVLKARRNLAQAYKDVGDWEMAVRHLEDARQKLLKDQHSSDDMWDILEQLAQCNMQQKDWAAVVLANQRKLGMAETRVDPVTDQCKCLNAIGRAQRFQEQHSEAVDSHNRELEIARSASNVKLELQALTSLAFTYCQMKNYEQAIAIHDERREIAWRIGDSLALARAHRDLGVIHNRMGDHTSAASHYRTHLDLAQRNGTKEELNGSTGDLLYTYAMLNSSPPELPALLSSAPMKDQIHAAATQALYLEAKHDFRAAASQHYRCVELVEMSMELSGETPALRDARMMAEGGVRHCYRCLSELPTNKDHLAVCFMDMSRTVDDMQFLDEPEGKPDMSGGLLRSRPTNV